VLDAARAREQRETGIRQRYRNGELGLDMNDMRPALAAKGLIYLDQEPGR
jgi:4-hydroxy-4-methyl-2-oxoglutarate aldolase